MTRFVDPQNDIAFKKIFGNEEHKEILISFLNAVLDLQGDREIAEIEILNPYQAPKVQGLKFTLLDVRARDKRGVTYEIAERFRWSEEELEVYDYWSMKAQDERGALTVAEERGEQKGRQAEKEQAARAMLADGLPIEVIAKYTGLSNQEVTAL